MNTRIIDAAYDYLRPSSLGEALEALATREGVKVLAGGTDLLVKLKTNGLPDLKVMLDIKQVGELDFVRENEAGALYLGPLAKLSRLEREPLVLERYPALAGAIQLMAAISVRNMGTMAGNICNASPVADSVIPAICYEAQVVLASRDRGQRLVALEDFFLAPGVSVLDKDELLTAIILPKPQAHTGAAFIKKTRVRPDIAKISICVKLARAGDSIADCRIALGAVAARPYFAKALSAALAGQKMTEELIGETAVALAAQIRPIDDNRTTAEYRIAVAEAITADALKLAWEQAGGEL